MFNEMEEVKQSSQYEYYKKLGYTGSQAVTFTLLDYHGYSRMRELGNAYSGQDDLNFSEFIEKYYFDRNYQPPLPERNSGSRGFLAYASVIPMDSYLESDDETQAKDTDSGAFRGKQRRDASLSFSHFRAKTQNVTGNIIDEAERLYRSHAGAPCKKTARTDTYAPIRKRGWRETITSPAAVFKPTHNSAAAGIIAANIRAGEKTTPSMVRTEELLNYLSYDLKQPEGKKFELTTEILHTEDDSWLFLGVQGEHVCPARKNICLLLDVSGSMSRRETCITGVTAAILAGMNPGDVLSLVTYADEDRTMISSLVLDETKNIEQILEVLSQIEIEGCTNGSAGLSRAYELIEKNHISDGVNRVIIVTDGDFNFGTFDNDSLTDFIRKKRETGAYFSVIGTGIYNLHDDRLEMLAENGNGNYFAVNSLEDVERSVRSNYEALMYPIAKNVKAMMEFNPDCVSAWQLMGYENRMLEVEEFRDDSVTADPFGSGAYFIGLFRVKMSDGKPAGHKLKYRNSIPVNSSELGTLTLRYEDIGDHTVKETDFVITDEETPTENVRKAVSCVKEAGKFRDKDLEDEIARRELMRLIRENQ